MKLFKYIFGTLLFLCFSITTAQSQWTLLNSGVSSYLRDLSFISANTGWVAGYDGTILKTTDAGFIWTTQNTNTSLNLYAIKFIGENIGWAGGESGVLLHTKDGGDTWDLSNVSYNIYSLDFFNEKDGLAVIGSVYPTRFGYIIKTSDEGNSWQYKVSVYDYTFLDIYAEGTNAWAVGTNGLCYKSTDKGETWFAKYTNTDQWLYEVYAANEDLAWAAGGNVDSEIIIITSQTTNNPIKETGAKKDINFKKLIPDFTPIIIFCGFPIIVAADPTFAEVANATK